MSRRDLVTYSLLLRLLLLSLFLAACNQNTPSTTSTVEQEPSNFTIEGISSTAESSKEQSPGIVAPGNRATPDSAAIDLPASCGYRPGRAQYISLHERICFTYPLQLSIDKANPKISRIISSPGVNGTAEAELAIDYTLQVREGVDLGLASQVFLAQYPQSQIRILPAALGREPALLYEQVPGNVPSRHLLAMHEQALYHLVFSPVAEEPVESEPTLMEELWRYVVTSFGYLSQGFIDTFGNCPQPMDGAASYLSFRDGYCLLYPDDALVTALQEQTVIFEKRASPWRLEITWQAMTDSAQLSELADSALDGTQWASADIEDDQIGGQPAKVARASEGQRRAFVLVGKKLFVVTLTADDTTDLEVGQEMWELMTENWVFLPEE